MACSDVKLACCKLCHKPIASNLGECIHCGVCKPVEKDKCPWWHILLVIMILVGTILATLRYDMDHPDGWDCRIERTGSAQDC